MRIKVKLDKHDREALKRGATVTASFPLETVTDQVAGELSIEAANVGTDGTVKRALFLSVKTIPRKEQSCRKNQSRK